MLFTPARFMPLSPRLIAVSLWRWGRGGRMWSKAVGRRPAGKTGMDSLRPTPTRSPPAGRLPASSCYSSFIHAHTPITTGGNRGGKGLTLTPSPPRRIRKAILAQSRPSVAPRSVRGHALELRVGRRVAGDSATMSWPGLPSARSTAHAVLVTCRDHVMREVRRVSHVKVSKHERVKLFPGPFAVLVL